VTPVCDGGRLRDSAVSSEILKFNYIRFRKIYKNLIPVKSYKNMFLSKTSESSQPHLRYTLFIMMGS